MLKFLLYMILISNTNTVDLPQAGNDEFSMTLGYRLRSLFKIGYSLSDIY